MQRSLQLLLVATVALPGAAAAQTTVLQPDNGVLALDSAWSLTSPNAGPNDWIGVGYTPPFEHPFRVVSAQMYFIDTFCCQPGPACDPLCGAGFNDWERRVITGADLAVDAAGLTPDLTNTLVNQTPVGLNPAAFSTPGTNTTAYSTLNPWTLTPDQWALPAGTVFDRAGRLFYAIKYFNTDQWMRFVTDSGATHPQHRAIFTNDGFATRAALWGFGNVAMRVTVEPLFFVKAAASMPAATQVFAGETGVTMLALRVRAGNGTTVVNPIEIDGSGTGHEQLDVQAVRLVLDADQDGVADPTETVLATGTFAADNGRVTLTPSRTLATAQTEEWLVVYDFASTPAGGETFTAALSSAARMNSNLGAPYVSGTTGGTGGITGPAITVAGSLRIAAGPAAPAARVVPAGATGVPVTQVELTAQNEDFTVSQLQVWAQGTVDDVTEVSALRLFDDANANGAVDAGEALLGTGTFTADDGGLAFALALSVARNTSRSVLVVVDLAATASGGDGFRAVVASAADVTAAGAASGPLPTTGPRALTGAPVIGELVTVGGALTAAVGAASPVSGTAQPGLTDVPMLQVELTAQAEAVQVATLTFEGRGTGDETTDVLRARLFRDDNANGTVEATDTVLGAPQSFFANDGAVTFALGAEVVPANATRRYLLAYDLSTAPTGSETFSARIVDAPGIVASGQASGAPVPATGTFPLVGRTLTLLGGLSVSVGPENPTTARVQPGATDVPVLQLSAAAQGEAFTVARLTLTAAGSVDDLAGVTGVRIYRDQGVFGVRDTPDGLLGTGTFAADDGQAVFNFSPALTLAPGANQRWLITCDLAATPSPGQTMRVFAADASAVMATGTLSGPASVSGLPASGPTLSIGGSLTFAAGPANPAGGSLSPGATGQAMLQLRASTDLEPITVSAVTLTGSGSGNESTGITAAHLYVDTNQDGQLDPLGDVRLAPAATFGANDGPVVFTLSTPRTLPAAAQETWLVVYDLGPNVTAGDSFALRLANATDVNASAPSGALPAVGGAPVAGGTRTVLGALDARLGANTPAARTVARNATDLAVVQVEVVSTAEAFVLDQLVIEAAGAMDDAVDVGDVEVFEDVDASGTLTTGDVAIAGPARFSSDDGRITFSGLGLNLAAGGTARLLVVADLTGRARGGTDLRLRIPTLSATGLQGRSVGAAGLPLGAAAITAGGALEVGLGAGSPLGRVARRLDTRVPGLQLRFVATSEPVDLSQVVLHGSGTGHDATGVTEIELWLDADADGLVSAGEPRLGRGTFGADDGAVTIALNQTVQVGPALHLLATYSLSASPVGGETFRLSFDPANDLTFSTVSGAVVVSGPAVTGGFVTVGGGFAVRAGPNTSPGGLVNQAIQNLAVMQLELEAVNERCTVERVTLRAAGGIDDATDVAAVRLALDADGDGAFTAADTFIAGPLTFSNDDAELSFGTVARTLAPNTSERWLVVYDLSGQASNLETFRARLEGADRVGVRCQVSGPLTPTGTAVDGGVFTIQEDGALVVRRGDQTPPSRFVPAGTVRTPALQVRAGASVQPLTLTDLTLTASVSQGPVLATVAGVDLFADLDQDGQLDRSDPLLGSATPDANGKLAFTGLSVTVPLDEAQFLLAAVDVASGAAPGARFALGLVQDADATASSGFGPAATTGAPFSGETLTVAGGLNVEAGRSGQALTVANDETGLVVLDLALSAVWEDFVVQRLTVSAQGSMTPSAGVRGLSLVEDVDDDGAVGAGDRPVASGLTFPEGSDRATFDGLDVAVTAGGRTRLLVVVDLDGVARVDETLQLVLTSDLDLLADGDRRGLTSPVGAPVAGDTLTVGASFQVSDGPMPPLDTIVAADALGVPALQIAVRASNEDVTLGRLGLDVSGSLDDVQGIDAFRLHHDVDGDGTVDPEDVELGAAARPAGDDGVVSFSPLQTRVPRNETVVLLVTADLSGSGQAGQTVKVTLSSDAAVEAFGARSGAVAARGAPVEGAQISLVGAMNVRLGPASPAGQGVWPGTTFGALQLELFTRGESVTVQRLRFAVGANPAAGIAQVHLVHDIDGDGVASDGEPVLGSAAIADGFADIGGLSLSLGLDGSARLLARVELAEEAAPGEMIRVSLAAAEDLEVSAASGTDVTIAGPPVLGSAFTVTRRPEPTEGGQAEGGCSCEATHAGAEGAPWAFGFLLLGVVGARRRRGKRTV